MTSKIYQEALPISREDAESAFLSGTPARICDALVRVTFNDSEWEWVQEQCVRFIISPIPDVRRLAVTCIGHLARIHGQLDLKRVVPLLNQMRNDAELGGTVEDALDDIEAFVKT
jgi:hypothetical protein